MWPRVGGGGRCCASPTRPPPRLAGGSRVDGAHRRRFDSAPSRRRACGGTPNGDRDRLASPGARPPRAPWPPHLRPATVSDRSRGRGSGHHAASRARRRRCEAARAPSRASKAVQPSATAHHMVTSSTRSQTGTGRASIGCITRLPSSTRRTRRRSGATAGPSAPRPRATTGFGGGAAPRVVPASVVPPSATPASPGPWPRPVIDSIGPASPCAGRGSFFRPAAGRASRDACGQTATSTRCPTGAAPGTAAPDA